MTSQWLVWLKTNLSEISSVFQFHVIHWDRLLGTTSIRWHSTMGHLSTQGPETGNVFLKLPLCWRAAHEEHSHNPTEEVTRLSSLSSHPSAWKRVWLFGHKINGTNASFREACASVREGRKSHKTAQSWHRLRPFGSLIPVFSPCVDKSLVLVVQICNKCTCVYSRWICSDPIWAARIPFTRVLFAVEILFIYGL